MIGNTWDATVALRFLTPKGDRPKHLLATAEFVLYFGGEMPDMRVTGMTFWRGESESTVTLTLPAGPGNTGEYYCFRPVSGDVRDLVRFKQQVIDAYRLGDGAPGQRQERMRAAVAARRCVEGGVAWESVAPPVLNPARTGARTAAAPIEAGELLRLLRECNLTPSTIAYVLGTTRSRLDAWEKEQVPPPSVDRVRDLGRIVAVFLRAGMAPRAVGEWLCAPNRHLEGRRPIELLGASMQIGMAAPVSVQPNFLLLLEDPSKLEASSHPSHPSDPQPSSTGGPPRSRQAVLPYLDDDPCTA